MAEGAAEDLLDDGVALLDGLADDPTPTLRWYRATDPALVLGRGQQRSLVRDDSFPVVTRFSGGGAVWMDAGLLCLDVLVPTGHPLLDGDLAMPFLHIGRAWEDALRRLGLDDVATHEGPATTPRKTDERTRLLAAVCYATLGRGEVTVAGRKIVGLSQRRRRPGALIQCGLLQRWRPGPLLRALGADPDDAEITRAAVGLDDLAAHPPSDDEIRAAVEAAFQG